MSAQLQPTATAPGADVSAASGASTYAQALGLWHGAEDIAAWAGRRFRFDAERALQFSSTQRRVGPTPTVADPEAFFAAPAGICLDLAHFAVETLRRIDPAAQARYLMVEFEPIEVDGHVLRLHWIGACQRDGLRYYFADSDRPGHVAGPYACAQEFVAEYAVFRGRAVVRHLELDSLQRPPPGTAAR